MGKFIEVDQLKKKLDEYRPLDSEKVSAIQEKFRIDWTYHSRAIEGALLTLSETAFFLQEGLTTKGKPLSEYLETKNHAEALCYLDDLVKRKEDLSERVIKDFHAILMKDTNFILIGPQDSRVQKKIEPGKYKYDNNHVIVGDGSIHYYTDHLQVPGEMEKLIKWYKTNKEEIHPIEVSALFHHKLTAIHPFTDGNGRVARLVMNTILMQSGYTPAIIRNEDRQDYYEALRQADEGKPDSFIAMVEKEVTNTITLMLNVIEGKEAFGLQDLDRKLDHFFLNIDSLDKDIGKISKDSVEERSNCQLLLHQEIVKLLNNTVIKHKEGEELSFFINPNLKINASENPASVFLYDIISKQNIIPLFEVVNSEHSSTFNRTFNMFRDGSNIYNSCMVGIKSRRKYIPSGLLVFTVIPTRYIIYLNSMILIWRFDFDKESEYPPDLSLITSFLKSGSISYKDWTKREIEDFFVESFNNYINQIEKEVETRRKIIADRFKK